MGQSFSTGWAFSPSFAAFSLLRIGRDNQVISGRYLARKAVSPGSSIPPELSVRHGRIVTTLLMARCVKVLFAKSRSSYVPVGTEPGNDSATLPSAVPAVKTHAT